MTADERRDAIVAAATEEFAIGGLVGASTEAIARQVGVSQPYVFQLFGTKKDLFIAVVRSCFARVTLAFEAAARNWTPEETDAESPLMAMGLAYKRLLPDRTLLLVQLQAYAACWTRTSGRRPRGEEAGNLGGVRRIREEPTTFFAEGMLLNRAATGLPGRRATDALDIRGCLRSAKPTEPFFESELSNG
jgi:AcrR family transcriptional regulator